MFATNRPRLPSAREVLLYGLSLLLGCIPQSLGAQIPADRLNILMLVADDQRWDSLGAAGNNAIHTPRLDQLASRGIYFTHGYVTTSICMTSRASILTGQYMSRHGIDRFGKPLAPDQFAYTYPAALRAAGYYSGFVGKYGVGDIPTDGFDCARVYSGRHWLDDNGARVHVTEQNARDAIEFIETRPIDRPFVLSVSFFAPHAEDAAPEQYLPQPWSAQFYESQTIPESPRMQAAYLEALPEFLRDPRNEGRVRFHRRFDAPERYQQSMRNYYRLVTEVDDAVGRMISILEQQGILDQTLILYIGDNGYFHADRGLADKWYPYEESIRVPLIIWDPRLPPERRGQRIDAIALNVDLAPTILQAANLPRDPQMQGRDLSMLYLSPDTVRQSETWRDEFFYEHPTITDRTRIPASQAVVRRDGKYVWWPEWDVEQFFDLRADPSELRDLAQDPAYREQLAVFRQKLAHWQRRVR